MAGDDRYGDKDFNEYLKSFGLQRVFLHAHSLTFEWPDTGETFNASVPLPDELRAVLTALEVKRSAAKEIGDLRKADCQRVVAKIRLLASDPRPKGCEKLSSAEKYRTRQGDYRILYEIDDSTKLVTVVKVGNRREVYR